MKETSTPIIKKKIVKILGRIFPRYRRFFKTFFFRNTTLVDFLQSQFNYRFKRKDSIILTGAVYSDNFGDYLNIPFFHFLSAKKVIYSNCIPKNNEESLMMIGSVLGRAKKNTIVWGAGCMEEDKVPTEEPLKICAVRGPLTRNALLKKGYKCPEVYGDPALLLPLFYNPQSIKKQYKLGVIPHYIDKKSKVVKDLSTHDDVLIIEIEVGKNWKTFIDELLSCETIISSSLHGVIVSEAYNVPNGWVEFSKGVNGNGFKFRDYYKSVGKDETMPLDLITAANRQQIDQFVQKWSKPKFDADKLMEAFPFKQELKN